MGSNSGHGKGGGKHQHFKKKTPKKPPKQNAYEVTFKSLVLSEVTTTSGGERENHSRVSSKDGPFRTRGGRYCTTTFLALQCIVKCLKAPMLRVSL